MKKITKTAVKKFLAGENWKQSNTQIVCYMGGLVEFWVNHKCIALYNKFVKSNGVSFVLRDFDLVTVERLRGLGLNLTIKNGQIYWDDTLIDTNKYYSYTITNN